MPTRRLLLAAPAVLAAAGASAHSYRFGDLMIGHAWCLPSPGPATRAFMPLAVTARRPDALVGASTPAARAVAFVPVAGRPAAPRWDILPGRPIGMRPDGPHLLLEGLAAPLAAGERLTLTLSFARNGTRDVEVWVETAPYSG